MGELERWRRSMTDAEGYVQVDPTHRIPAGYVTPEEWKRVAERAGDVVASARELIETHDPRVMLGYPEGVPSAGMARGHLRAFWPSLAEAIAELRVVLGYKPFVLPPTRLDPPPE